MNANILKKEKQIEVEKLNFIQFLRTQVLEMTFSISKLMNG